MNDGELVRSVGEIGAMRRVPAHELPGFDPLVDTLPAPKVDVWVAAGLRRRYRVVSIGRTYGEWDSLADATRFLHLLVAGNPDLEVLR